jgi:hypothetical protein
VSAVGAETAGYAPHALHGADRTYVETNCYTDVLVELLHAHGAEPLAMLGSNVRMDFEGDQWTFFKPAPGDLEALYGVDVHEMQPYRPLADQIAEQLEAGRTLIAEVDSYWLPDTAATAYRADHVKTSIAAAAIDREAQWLAYFHNAGRHELRGEDYRGLFAAGGLPPYVELVRFDAGPRLEGDALRAAARAVTAHHLARRPATNPFTRFGAALERDLPALLDGDDAGYHAYAFATVRMAGAGFELLGAHVRWLLGEQGEAVVAATDEIVAGSKLLSLKLARRRAFDPAPVVDGLAAAWERVAGGLDAALA